MPNFFVFQTLRLTVLAAAVATLAGCATKPPATDTMARVAYEEANDPFEPANRVMYSIDQGFDKVLFRPVVKVYRTVVPARGRQSVGHFVDNLRSPITFAHDVLQAEPERAGITLARMVINTTIGFFGFFDVATEIGLPFHSEDFGQTFAKWGLDSGPYVYVPILGPSSFRDGIGFAIDAFAVDPLSWYDRGDGSEGWVQWTSFGLLLLDTKDGTQDALDELKKSSIDSYAALRSAYRQIRENEIRNGAPPPLEDFDE